MKTLFYAILNFILLISLLYGVLSKPTFETEKHRGCVVVGKSYNYLIDYNIQLKYPNDSVDVERVYQIFYEKYNVGDTIK